jgi:hypothetical protein
MGRKDPEIEVKTKNSRGTCSLIGAHRHDGRVICPPHRSLHPPKEFVGSEGRRSHLRALHVGLGRHLIEADRRSISGITLCRWNAATTPAAVRPRSRSLFRASSSGFRWVWSSRGRPHL